MSISDHPLTRPSVSRLRSALTPQARGLLDATIAAAEAAPVELWAVGGCIRDVAAGYPVRDVDVATSDDPERLAIAVAAAVGGAARYEPRFHTARVSVGAAHLDFAALRTERYARPGALPTVRLGATIEDDLARRDFTVNAFALQLSHGSRGAVVDPLGGLEDLRARTLRVLHPRSFIDDATRLWRGARYAARLDLRPDRATAALIEDGAHRLDAISGARLWAEFERTAEERRVARTLALLDAWGVLRATHVDFSFGAAARRALAHRRGPLPADLLLALLLAPLDLEVQARIEARIAASRAAVRAVADATRLLAASDADPETLEALRTTGGAGRTAALWLAPDVQRPLQRALRRWERTQPSIAAAEAIQLGVKPGPALGMLLARLRRARYLGTLTGAAEARREVRRWLAEEAAS